MVALIGAGEAARVPASSLITRRYSFFDINDALEDLKRGLRGGGGITL